MKRILRFAAFVAALAFLSVPCSTVFSGNQSISMPIETVHAVNGTDYAAGISVNLNNGKGLHSTTSTSFDLGTGGTLAVSGGVNLSDEGKADITTVGILLDGSSGGTGSPYPLNWSGGIAVSESKAGDGVIGLSYIGQATEQYYSGKITGDTITVSSTLDGAFAVGASFTGLGSGGQISLQSISATGFNGDVIGLSIGSITKNSTTNPTILVSGKITAKNTGTTGDVIAVDLGNISGGTQTYNGLEAFSANANFSGDTIAYWAGNIDAATIKTGNISARTTTSTGHAGGDTFGFTAGDVSSSKIEIGSIETLTNGNGAYSVGYDVGEFKNSTLTIDGIVSVASSNGIGVGVSFAGLNGSSVSLSEIDVQAGNTAYGLYIGDITGTADLILTDPVSVRSTGDIAYGIYAEKEFNNYLNRSGTGTNMYSEGLIVDSLVHAVSDTSNAYAVYAGGNGTNLITLKSDAQLIAEGKNPGESYGIYAYRPTGTNHNVVYFDMDGTWNNGYEDFTVKGITDMVVENGRVVFGNSVRLERNGAGNPSTVSVESGATLVLDARLQGNSKVSTTEDVALRVDRLYVEDGGKLDAFRAVDAADPFDANGNVVIANTILEGDLYALNGSSTTFRVSALNGGGGKGYNGGLYVDGDIVMSPASSGDRFRTQINVVVDRRVNDFEYLELLSGLWTTSAGNTTQGLALANAALATNSFYELQAVNAYFDEYGNPIQGGAIIATKRTEAHMSEGVPAGITMHDHLTVYKPASNQITQKFYRNYLNRGYTNRLLERVLGHGILGQERRCCHDFWVNWVGRSNSKIRSNFSGRSMDFRSDGVQVGYHIPTRKDTVLGVMFGHESREMEFADGFGSNLDAKDIYFGIYGARMYNCCWDMRFMAGFGRQGYDLSRTSNVAGVGLTRHYGDYDGTTAEVTLELGRRFYTECHSSLRPVIALDFFNTRSDGFQEQGVSPYVYGKSTLTQLFIRAGSDLQWNRDGFNVHAAVYYSHQLLGDGDEVSTMVTDTAQAGVSLPLRYGLGDSMLSVNVGGAYTFGSCGQFTLYGDYYADCFADRGGTPALHTGTFGLRWCF